MKTKIIISIALLLTVVVGLCYTSNEELFVKGNVTDASDGSPLVGVTVQARGKGLSVDATTNSKGDYAIKAVKGQQLTFSYVGYETQTVTANKSTINIALRQVSSLDELQEIAVVANDSKISVAEIEMSASKNDIQYESAKRARKEQASPLASQVVVTGYGSVRMEYANTEEYGAFIENRFKPAKDEPLSTFSVDVDAASYSNMRRFLNQGQMPPKDAIRTEELINYFSYDYSKPKSNDPVSITTEVGACPSNTQNRLVRIGVKAREIASTNLPASNFVFLIDVSGSMYGPTRLELVKSSLKLLTNNLREEDRVAIVVYAGAAGVVLPSTSGQDKQKIRESLDNLTAGGSTAGGAGIQLAYQVAKQNFIKGGNNRIILCTDGDFNVGVSSNQGLESLIETERKSGVFLSILGYGMGNYKDSKMQTLAQKGNGNHAYIDNLQEANKVLVNEFGSTMYTVAKDVKLQIEFNPAIVQAYRLVGYESRLLNKEDFNDDTKDAGEMGAGHTVTAFYEIIPAGAKNPLVDDLKYQSNEKKVAYQSNSSEEMLTVKLRYKQPDASESKKMEIPLIDNGKNNVSDDFKFASAVAMFGQLLTESDFKGEANYDKVLFVARMGLKNDPQGYRHEFVRLVETAKGMANQQ